MAAHKDLRMIIFDFSPVLVLTALVRVDLD